jgi:sulfite exporter TauE/SafE/copper chaperone CopZ
MERKMIPIKGMHCRSCEILLEQQLQSIPGIKKVKADHKTRRVEIHCEGAAPSDESIEKVVRSCGYEVGTAMAESWISKDKNDYVYLLEGGLALLLVFLAAKFSGLMNIGVGDMQNAGILIAFVVGLTAGVSTCMALVGGLVLSISARFSELHPKLSAKEKFTPHLYFNLGRIVGFGILGGVLASLGSVLQISNNILGIMTVAIGLVMMFLGLKLIEIFPSLRTKTISLPKSISKLVGAEYDKGYSHPRSLIAGALTFFLPCGFTQSMQLYAIGSGSFANGALIMSLFALGTAPGLLGIGGLSSIFKGKNARIFFAASGLAVIFFGWMNISNGSQLIFQEKTQVKNSAQSSSSQSDSPSEQEIRMTQDDSGYSPNVFTVKKGVKIRWVINSLTQFSCASSISIPEYGIDKRLSKGENVIEFTPTQTGEISFSCSMGMYRGKFVVID